MNCFSELMKNRDRLRDLPTELQLLWENIDNELSIIAEHEKIITDNIQKVMEVLSDFQKHLKCEVSTMVSREGN